MQALEYHQNCSQIAVRSPKPCSADEDGVHALGRTWRWAEDVTEVKVSHEGPNHITVTASKKVVTPGGGSIWLTPFAKVTSQDPLLRHNPVLIPGDEEEFTLKTHEKVAKLFSERLAAN